MNRIEAAIAETRSRWDASDREMARQAKREGWPVVGRSVYPMNNKLYVEVVVPAEWRKLEAWRNMPTITVPADAYDQA